MARGKRKRRRERSCRGKRRYRDKQEALGALRLHQNYSRREVVPVRSYFCVVCRGYHMTSAERWGGGSATMPQ